MAEGFLLDVQEIAETIHKMVAEDQAGFGIHYDAYAMPTRSGSIEHQPVDKAVFYFVGPRKMADVFAVLGRAIADATRR